MYFCISASLFPVEKFVTIFDTVAVTVWKHDGIQTDIQFFCQQCNRFKSWVAASEFNFNDGTNANVQLLRQCPLRIIDEDIRFNAQRFEERFYQGNTPEANTIPHMPKFESSTELPEAAPIESDKKDETVTDAQADTELIVKLLSNPETAALLKALASKL